MQARLFGGFCKIKPHPFIERHTRCRWLPYYKSFKPNRWSVYYSKDCYWASRHGTNNSQTPRKQLLYKCIPKRCNSDSFDTKMVHKKYFTKNVKAKGNMLLPTCHGCHFNKGKVIRSIIVSHWYDIWTNVVWYN